MQHDASDTNKPDRSLGADSESMVRRVAVPDTMPRLPLEGSIDLTYRCNHHCRHCWLWEAEGAPVVRDELSFDEIRRIVDEARAYGCRRWKISGGEPMLREDFSDIFEYLTGKAIGYSLNTNGTLITPDIARLLTRKGDKMIALYGATAEVYDHVARHPGGFDKAMQGFAYLKEAGVGFTVQLIPMRDNWHQWDEMVALAKRLSPRWRVGASWLFGACDASPARQRAIAAQRLDPAAVIALDPPNLSYAERTAELSPTNGAPAPDDDRLFAACIENRRDFHIDAYGGMSWCIFVKDPSLRFDLRRGSFQEAWDVFIPGCAEKVRGGAEWREGCGTCDRRSDCRWCAVYAYLETGRYSAPVPYLCSVAKEAETFKAEWPAKHRRYFGIAGISVRIESDLDLSRIPFKEELLAFAVDGPGEDNITLRHHFEMPDLKNKDLGTELYRGTPWAISRKDDGTWFYRGITPNMGDAHLHRLAVFSPDHRHATIYSPPGQVELIQRNGFHSLALFPTDQIWLTPLLADRGAVLLHSGAAKLNGRGFVFVGHSSAGKSTTMELLKAARAERGLDAEILCDDRNVLRRWPDGWRVHGTWSHGTTTDVSPAEAPLQGIFFLEQSTTNRIQPLTDRKQVWRLLLATLIRAMVTAEWWNKQLDILEQLVDEVPCYRMQFDKTGAIVPMLEQLADEPKPPAG